MSTNKPPVGRPSQAVYWRRRLLVILALVAIVVVIVLIIVRPGSGSGTPTATPTTTAASTPAANSTTIPTSAATASGAPCKPANVDVEAITDNTSYAAGQNPQLSLSLTNTGKTSCTIDAGTAKMVFTITSGSEIYWKSTDCQTAPVDTVILLLPGKTVTSNPVAWDRTRSSTSTCNAQRDPVPAAGASYHLQTSVDGIVSKTTKQFLLN